MVNYANGKIYKLVSSNTDLIYIGSTTQSLSKRKHAHINSYKLWQKGKYSYVTSFKVIEKGDIDIVLIEECSCNTKAQLHACERHHIEINTCVNKNIPTRTDKEYRDTHKHIYKDYYKANKTKILERVKKYSNDNKDKIKNYRSQYYKLNKNQIAQKNKVYVDTHKQSIAQYKKNYSASNKSAIAQKRRLYYEKNKDKIALKHKEKVTCVCGRTVVKVTLKRHMKTQVHLNSVQ